MDILAGSCSAETREEILKQAKFVFDNNLYALRLMLWKPRTNKESFQGIGEEGIEIAKEISSIYPTMRFVTEVMDNSHVDLLSESGLDFMYQVGARNCQNYGLLKYLGKLKGKQILFKRGFSTTIDEYINAAEYLEPELNDVWLCLRGIRTFDDCMRNTPDIGALLVLKDMFEYDKRFMIGFDPSHATGKRKFIKPFFDICKTCGCDFVEIEIHSSPDEAWSDSSQTVSFDALKEMIGER